RIRDGSGAWSSSHPSSRRDTRRLARWPRPRSRPAVCSCPSPPGQRPARRDAARCGPEGHRRARGQGTALAESAPLLIPPPPNRPSLWSPLPTRADQPKLRQCAAYAIPSTSCQLPLRRARYVATLLGHSHLSIWLSQIVQSSILSPPFCSPRGDVVPMFSHAHLPHGVGETHQPKYLGRITRRRGTHQPKAQWDTSAELLQEESTPCRIRTCD